MLVRERRLEERLDSRLEAVGADDIFGGRDGDARIDGHVVRTYAALFQDDGWLQLKLSESRREVFIWFDQRQLGSGYGCCGRHPSLSELSEGGLASRLSCHGEVLGGVSLSVAW